MEFIVGLRKHKLFGFTASAYWIEKDQEESNFYKIKQNILLEDAIEHLHEFTAGQANIIKLLYDLSEQRIYRKFLKKRNTTLNEFFSTLDEKYLEEYILPYVGRIINKIFKISYWENIKIFLKPYRYNKVFADDQLFYIYEEVEPVFNFNLESDKLEYDLKLFHRGIALDLMGKEITFIANEPCIFLLDNRIYHSDTISCKKIKPFLDKPSITVRSKIENYLNSFVKKIITTHKVNIKGFDIKTLQPQKKAVLTLEQFLNRKWGFSLKFYYDDIIFTPQDKNDSYVKLVKEGDRYVFYVFKRDLSWEENIIYALKRSGLRCQLSHNTFIVPSAETSADRQLHNSISWLNEHSEVLDNLGIKVIQKTEKEYYTHDININFKLEKKIDWFDIYATVKFGDIEIPFIQLRDHILNGEKEIKLPNGQIAIIPDYWFERYKKIMLFAKKGNDKKTIKLSKTHFTLLEEIDHPQVSFTEIKRLAQSFKKKQWTIPELPASITAKLRNYQKKGYAWIYHLCKHGFGGCLADDMGLGKTIQTITAIAKTTEEAKKKKAAAAQTGIIQQPSLFHSNGTHLTSLIVVPKSLIHNWINEFRKFAPSFSLINYTGTNRFKLRDLLVKHDIVLTSYGIVRNDIDFLSQLDFFYVILDESQYIKNPHSKVFHAVRKLKAQHRLILTGTPIENSLSDLWTQMSFVNPGLLGSYSFFKKHFITPIEKNGSPSAKQELKNIISPFILRRTKEEVVKDLPELIEQTIFCEMTEDQALLYETEKSKVRNEILKVYEQGRLKESSVYVLSALTRLRQIANHPSLVEDKQQYSSGKFDIVTDKINTVLQEGHKLLLFSSFVKHLEIYQKYFEQQGLPYVMLTGESENRKEIIHQFQNNDKVNLFLISLKAGGVGLNLTAADYVFILDPWWNPAAEQQAISRAHRIGQQRPVIVYRFITVGTVEQKIQLLQEKKNELFTEFVESTKIFASLSDDNVVELFS